MVIQKTEVTPRITLITEEMPNLQSTAIGFFLGSGSRYENIKEQGITHLLEHMFFKGTKKKSAIEISQTVESLGATIDGFTGKEMSGVLFHCLTKNVNALIDLFFDIHHNLSFDEQELENEKTVILQEIAESYENPQEYTYQLFTEIMFPNHPLSYPIAGTPESLKSFHCEDLIQRHQHDTRNGTVCISAAGNVNHQQILDNVVRNQLQDAAQCTLTLPEKPPLDIERAVIFQRRPELKQIHTIAGFLTIPYKDERRYPFIVLHSIFGGLQSSRLNQRLREQDGLLYSIFTFLDFYSDVGLFCGYHISDIKNREQSLRVAFEEWAKINKSGINKDEFERSINYCKGMLALSGEDPMSRMTRNARKFILAGEVISVEESITAFENLTLDQVNSTVDLLRLDQYSAAIIGPVTDKELAIRGIVPFKLIEK